MLQQDKRTPGKSREERMTRDELNAEVWGQGGLEYTRSVSGRYYSKSAAVINELEITDTKRQMLKGILERACRMG